VPCFQDLATLTQKIGHRKPLTAPTPARIAF
jgi:hypothetical protein